MNKSSNLKMAMADTRVTVSNRPMRAARSRIAPLALFVLCAVAAGCDRVDDTEPPTVAGRPTVERLGVDHFRVTWNAAEDDVTRAEDLQYEIGVARTDVCVVPAADYTVVGETELEIWLDEEETTPPLIGFTLRTLDEAGQSRGYSGCAWVQRTPPRVPVFSYPGRTPGFPPAEQTGPDTTCRADGRGGVWCSSARELSHFNGARWDVFPLPVGFTTRDWTPLHDYVALANDGRTQVYVSRANGLQSLLISSGSETFDGSAGTVPTGPERGFVAIRGFVARFFAGNIDLAGPPSVLGLDDCRTLTQLGESAGLVYANCEDGGWGQLRLGEAVRERFAWERNFDLTAHLSQLEPDQRGSARLEGLVGTRDQGIMALTTETSGALLLWEHDSVRVVPLPALAGTGRPRVAVSGPLDMPFAIATRGGEFEIFNGSTWIDLPEVGDDVIWRGEHIPDSSHFVGTPDGVMALSPRRSLLINWFSAELLVEHRQGNLGVRGLDGRHYMLRGPTLGAISSSRQGRYWTSRRWSGPELEPHSLTVTPLGAVYVSGTLHGSDQVAVFQSGDRARDLTPVFDQTPTAPPTLAVDGNGRLYAHADGQLRWLEPNDVTWQGPVAATTDLIALIGSDDAVYVVSSDEVQQCDGATCHVVSPPNEANDRITAALVQPNGFCAIAGQRGVWCHQEGADRWRPLTVEMHTATRFGLAGVNQWRVIDLLELPNDELLLAIETDEAGYAAVLGQSGISIVAEGLHWGRGAVLAANEVDGLIVALEAEGPSEIRYRGGRTTERRILY